MASAQLNEARDALHKLLTGKQVVTVSRDGKSVTFTPGNVNQLRMYITELERKEGINATGRRGPAGVY